MSTAVSVEQTKIWKAYLLPALAALVPLTIAFVGAAITGTDTTAVVDSVFGVSGRSSQALGDFSTLLPLGFAFGAGLVASVNPCGFAMLPAYLALYVGSNTDEEPQANILNRLSKALLVGGVVTLGFIVLFGIAGIIIGGGARQVVDIIPWFGLIIGVVLTFVGAWLIGGGKIYTAIAQQASTKMGDPNRVSVRGYFFFGLSYGTASLSCTLPIFLAVLGIGVATNTIVDSVVSFVLFALGMGTVIIVLTIAMAVFKGAMVGALRKILPYTQPISATFMILAGTYITFYWLTEGGLVDKLL